jgi:DNA mismatch repair protein MutS2
MREMDQHTLRLLEFQKIRDELCEYCFSSQGRELIGIQAILTDPAQVKELLENSLAMRILLSRADQSPPLDFPDMGSFLPRLEKQGAVLEAEELSCIGRYIRSATALERFVRKNADGETERLTALVEALPDLEPLAREIFRIVDQAGRLREKEIPELAAIAKKLKSVQREMDRLVAGYLDNPDYRPYWQNTKPTERDGRMVLALKSNFKGRIKGIVHEVSSSGATVFLEPFDVVERNNTIVAHQSSYRREALKVLRRLTARVASSLSDLIQTVDSISFIDSLYAKASYAMKHDCNPARHAPGEVRLVDARHPLLGRHAVPISVTMDNGCRTLIITGPNTGGKTVSLKTVGLLSLMNQFGMEIPAAVGCCLEIFDGCFADIGDEQSIEQSLSTFSSHVVSISRIVAGSTRRSLVLLDELGAGTDPEEGVALAMALLDHFIDKGCLTICTTHHGILKNYGYTREGVQNACMEFDKKSLVPTFRIVVGIPGDSHALEIARREGMASHIVDRANGYLNDERSDIGELIRRLSEKQRELLETERSHRARESRLREIRREADLKELRVRQKELELREHGLKDIRGFLDSSRRELDELIRQIREGELSKEKTRKASRFLQRLREKVEREEKVIEEQREEEIPEDFEIEAGMPVVLKRSGREGRILRKGKGERWVIETDQLRVSLLPHEFSPASGHRESVEIVSSGSLGDKPELELDVRGFRYEQAIDALRRQIDNAILSGLREFSVIHGKGEGILQEGIQRYLRESPEVESFSFSHPESGGFGKTVVTLKT